MTPEEIKAARKAKGWNQTQLAEKMGTDLGTVSRWERGVTTPRGPSLKLLETLLGPTVWVQVSATLAPDTEKYFPCISVIPEAKPLGRRQAFGSTAWGEYETSTDAAEAALQRVPAFMEERYPGQRYEVRGPFGFPMDSFADE